MGGPPLEFINIQPPKRGPPLEFINQRGSASRFYQLDGGLPLEFININLKMGGPPLEFININLKMGALGTISMDLGGTYLCIAICVSADGCIL